jgi:hypothetical protein
MRLAVIFVLYVFTRKENIFLQARSNSGQKRDISNIGLKNKFYRKIYAMYNNRNT